MDLEQAEKAKAIRTEMKSAVAIRTETAEAIQKAETKSQVSLKKSLSQSAEVALHGYVLQALTLTPQY